MRSKEIEMEMERGEEGEKWCELQKIVITQSTTGKQMDKEKVTYRTQTRIDRRLT